MKKTLKILAIGDVVGRPGREVLKNRLQNIIDIYQTDIVIANGENAAGGRSLTPDTARELFSIGIDVITSGNHIWDNREILNILDKEPAILRPANYPERVKGHGHYLFQKKGYTVCVINLQGRLFMTPIDCPFKKFDEIYDTVRNEADIIIVDFHAEATSEKRAFGWYVDGRASAVFGTHTHVQTSDEEILTSGTGYITDTGMTGAFDSVIGIEKAASINRFLTHTRVKFSVAEKNPKINGIVFNVDQNGKTIKIQRIIA